MTTRFVSSVSFQISAAFGLLLALFAAACIYSVSSLQRQLDYTAVVYAAGRLELAAQHLYTQAMNYEMHAPQDTRTYHRDIGLYYRDLLADVETIDRIIEDFMHADFRDEDHGPLPWLQPQVGSGVTQACRSMEQTWSDYRKGLFAALGPDDAQPRLAYAARYNMENHGILEQAANDLTESMRVWVNAERRRITRVAFLLLAAGSAITLALLSLLYFKTLAPLRRTIVGIQRVAGGDFGHRIRISGASEVRRLTESFNGLSGYLDVLFKLLERLQRGNDLDEVIRFLGREFPDLLRVDWVGVVLLTSDRSRVCLEVSYLDGEPERLSKQPFRLKGTLLEQALDAGTPFHVPDMGATADANPHYEFLRSLVQRGLKDAIFLPLTPQTLTPIPAVVVFATRTQESYDEAHLRFLDNIAQLVTHSFGRTVRLAEQGRLAAIGELVSGIAHELRTPLTTIALALDSFERLPLDDKAGKRLRLARQESNRMQRLLEQILLYARPLDLVLETVSAYRILAQFVEDHQELGLPRKQTIVLAGREISARIMADCDRLIQILLNLTQNACEAAPEGAQISWRVDEDPSSDRVVLEVRNPGDPIPKEGLERLTEPFYSTKPAGIGLGLAIVRRLTLDHGAELSFHSDEVQGTRVRLLFPKLAADGIRNA